MNNTSILIVEDESLIAHDLALSMMKFGYQIANICSDGLSAIAYMQKENNVSMILMDINLENSPDGIETVSKIQAIKNVPVIYITAYIDEKTIQRATETQPSGYITKPFNDAELLAATKIALNTLESNSNKTFIGDVVFDESFSFDTAGKQLICNEKFVDLTKKELELLTLLVHRKNSIVPFDIVEYEIWPDKEPNDNTRRTLIRRLRSKLNNQFIETIISMGYRLRI